MLYCEKCGKEKILTMDLIEKHFPIKGERYIDNARKYIYAKTTGVYSCPACDFQILDSNHYRIIGQNNMQAQIFDFTSSDLRQNSTINKIEEKEHCPNCGAVLVKTPNGEKYCEYCSSLDNKKETKIDNNLSKDDERLENEMTWIALIVTLIAIALCVFLPISCANNKNHTRDTPSNTVASAERYISADAKTQFQIMFLEEDIWSPFSFDFLLELYRLKYHYNRIEMTSDRLTLDSSLLFIIDTKHYSYNTIATEFKKFLGFYNILNMYDVKDGKNEICFLIRQILRELEPNKYYSKGIIDEIENQCFSFLNYKESYYNAELSYFYCKLQNGEHIYIKHSLMKEKLTNYISLLLKYY